MITLPRRSPDLVLLGATLVGLAGGAVAQAAGFDRVGIDLWIGVQALGVALAAWWVMRAVRAHRLGVDMIALAALIGTLAVGEHLAGALIGVMLTTGRTLEAWAAGRAERELRALLDLAPKVAYRYGAAGLEHPLVEELAVGDRLLIRSGEVVPVDGTVIGHAAVLDLVL